MKKDDKVVVGEEPTGETKVIKMDLRIPDENHQLIRFRVRGVAPYVQNAWSAKSQEQMRKKQKAGSVGKIKRGKRDPKDFEQAYRDAMHISREGWHGIPAAAFRKAMISACRTVDFQMSRAKLAIFIEADGLDKVDGSALVRITKGKPHYVEHGVRNATSVDLRPRPMWDEWEAVVVVKFDADMLSAQDVFHLMKRAGSQVGIGEGRHDSRESAGMGWGTFQVMPL